LKKWLPKICLLVLISCGGGEDCTLCGTPIECRDMSAGERMEWDFVRECMDTDKIEPIIVIYDSKGKAEAFRDGDFICMPLILVGKKEYAELFRHELTHYLCDCDHDSHWFKNPECIIL
jgi:hypothetical protein